MTKIQQHDELWQACSAGTIDQMAGALRARRGVRAQRQVAVASGVGVALVAVAIALGLSTFLWGPREYRYGGIACSEVQSLLPAYLQGALADRQLARRIDRHLPKCPECGPLARQTQAAAAIHLVAEPPIVNYHAWINRAHHDPNRDLGETLSLASVSAVVAEF